MNGDHTMDFSEFFEVKDEGEAYTHVQYYPETYIKPYDVRDFYTQYAEKVHELQQEDERDTYPNIGVRYEGIVPLVLRLRLIFKGEYDAVECDQFYLSVVKVAQQCIRRMFVLTEGEGNQEQEEEIVPELVACLMEGNDIFYQDKTYVSAMIHFPNCRARHTDVLERFYPMIHRKLKEVDVIKELGEMKGNLDGDHCDIPSILSREEARRPLPLYMSRMGETYPSMEVTHIFPEITVDVKEYEEENDLNVNRILDIQSHYLTRNDEPDENEISYYYTYLFDTKYMDEDTKRFAITPIVDDFDLIPKTPMPVKKNAMVEERYGSRGRDLTICKKMIQILKNNPTVMRDYEQIIGMSIYGSDKVENGHATKEGEEIYFDVKKFVTKEHFNIRRARIEYKDFRNQGVVYTYKSLCYITMLYEKEKFEEWHFKWVNDAIENAIKKVEMPTYIAEVIYRQFFMYFIVSQFAKDVWYYFNGYIWEESDKTVKIRNRIQEDIVPMFQKRTSAYAKMRDEENDERNRDLFTSNIKRIEMIVTKLSTSKGINEMISLLRPMFYDETFNINANKNINVLGIQNGVLEATKTKIVFRPGIPQDYITKMTNSFYEEDEYNWNHPQVKFLMNWFKQMWPSTVSNYVLKFIASAFIGKNLDKIFLLFSGGGDNGKSKFGYLNNITFGDDYYVDVAAEAFTRKKMSASGPTQEWEDARDSRLVCVNEPSEDFYSDTLKRITGGEGIRSRGLLEKGGKMAPSMKILIYANEPPGFHSDKAMMARFRLIECIAKYVAPTLAPKTEEEQMKKRIFPMDKNIEVRLDKCKDAYLWILCEYYKMYREEGLETPAEVVKSAAKYWKKYDVTKSFISEYLDCKDANGNPLTEANTIPLNELYKTYAGWHVEIHPNKKVPDVNSFRYNIAQKGVEMNEDETLCTGMLDKDGVMSKGIRNKKINEFAGNLAGLVNANF